MRILKAIQRAARADEIRRRRDARGGPGDGPARSPRRFRRRGVLAGGGALILSFSLLRGVAQEAPRRPHRSRPKLPGSLDDAPFLDSWIRIDADGTITVFTGKAELGQGMKTALLQVAAEELEVEPGDITLVTADTGADAR